ncbi:MAG: EAL domain-containing protein [Terracidiphilus sp.]
MSRSGDRFLWAAAIAGALLAGGSLGGAFWDRSVFPTHKSIRELPDLPLHSSVHLVGVVTYTDIPANRFWIEDETGAAVLLASPVRAGVKVGETVAVDAAKTSRYDTNVGAASMALKNVTVRSSLARVKLPPPFPASLANFPDADKNGARVQISGVVQEAHVDGDGRAWLSITGSGSTLEVSVARPGGDYSKLVNATIRVTGLTELLRNSDGTLVSRQLWVPSGSDLEVEQPAPARDPLYSIRGLYRDSATVTGHRIRIRGRAAAVFPDSILLEDRWGAIECRLDRAPGFRAGSAVEVTGFPNANGLRLDLFDAYAVEVPDGQANPPGEDGDRLPPLATVAAVRTLSASQAALALPVRITGVITHNDSIWRQLFLQDSTGGIYVKYSGAHPELCAGLRVTATGITNPGNYAPVIVAPKFRVDGTAPFPAPVPATPEAANAGLLDSQYVSVEGVVHPIKFGEDPGHPILTFELYSSFGQIHVSTSPGFPDLRQTGNLEDARVRIRGVFGTLFNSRRQLVGYQLLISTPSQIQVIEPAVRDPFAMEATPIGALLRFSPGVRFGHRVKVAGSVTMTGSDFLYLQDQSGGVELHGKAGAFRVGQRIEAIGYPSLVGRYSPDITDAEFRSLPGLGQVSPRSATAESILKGRYDSQLVTTEGRLLTALHGPGTVNLVLQSGIQTFTAQLDTADLGAAPWKFREGSVLDLTGVASAQIDPNKLYRLLDDDPATFRILLRRPEDVAVLRAAPLWTARTLLPLLVLFSLLIVAALVWVGVLRRRVHAQEAALEKASQTAQAIRDLSAAMQEVSSGQRFDTQVSVRGSEDIAQLVVGFNRMLAQLLQQDRARRDAEAKLQHQALVDELTGLPNRRLLSDRLSHSLNAARRDHGMVGLLYIDLDGFKLVNDSLGHAAGDVLLVEVGRRLKARTRESDTLARIGGDEFTVILDRIQTRADAERVAEGLLDSLASPFRIEGHEITIGASIGISIFPDHGSANDDLLQQADSAMYAAKQSGKNRVVHFSNDLSVAVRERLILENELRRAVANGEIYVHYQPEFNLATNSILRFEALARWTHPNLGVIPPTSFIPVAEECGLIVPLGAYVMEQACRQALSWQAIAGRPVQVAINVSSVQFARETFIAETLDILERTGLPASLLQLELTESVTLIGIDRAAEMIQRLKNMGISVVMDDFGSGYSCLSYLPKLPFDALKIDRSFVSELAASPETRALVQSILILARNLGMKVIVEGIENEAQLRLIRAMGGVEGQGYLLGRPTANPHAELRLRRASMEDVFEGNFESVL